jgi:hypothetical protein
MLLLSGVLLTIAGLSPVSSDLVVDGAGGTILGLFILLCGVAVIGNLGLGRPLGATILVASLVSLLFGGGFLIGFSLGLVAGVLLLAWRPTPAFYIVPEGWFPCPTCGGANKTGAVECKECGEDLTFWLG